MTLSAKNCVGIFREKCGPTRTLRCGYPKSNNEGNNITNFGFDEPSEDEEIENSSTYALTTTTNNESEDDIGGLEAHTCDT